MSIDGVLGRPRVHHRLTDSTNERAKALAAAGAPHGTLVTADEQSAGRGRQGRSWMAPPGRALLMSLLLRGLDDGDAVLPLAAAVAVCEACEAVSPVRCDIKWPNDVWIEGRKVAGILVEGRPHEGWAVLGIGLNTNTMADELADELRGIATSLAMEAGRAGPAEPEAVLVSLLERLSERLAGAPSDVLAAWRARDALRGRRVLWADGEGTAAGISDAGALLVETAGGGIVELRAGEVHLQRA